MRKYTKPMLNLCITLMCYILLFPAGYAGNYTNNTENEVHFIITAEGVPSYDGDRRLQCKREHKNYNQALKDAGFNVFTFKNSSQMPASMFVEDPAVVLGFKNGQYHVVINRVGSYWRTTEGESLIKYFENLNKEKPIYYLYNMLDVPDATLDGGDVLRIENHLFIGLSPHTNEKGANFLASAASSFGLVPHIVDVPKGLHLKSACSLAMDKVVVFDPELASSHFLNVLHEYLPDYRTIGVEHLGSNVLYLGKSPKTKRHTALVSSQAGTTAQMLRKQFNMDIIELEQPCHEELQGRLTCTSLRFPLPQSGAWAT